MNTSWLNRCSTSEGCAVSKNSVSASTRFARASSIEFPSLATSNSGQSATKPSSSRSMMAVRRLPVGMLPVYSGAHWLLIFRDAVLIMLSWLKSATLLIQGGEAYGHDLPGEFSNIEAKSAVDGRVIDIQHLNVQPEIPGNPGIIISACYEFLR